jgi:hypothetical protein
MPLDEFYFLRTNRNKILALNNEIQSLSEKIDMTKKALEENEETLYSEKYGSRVAKNGNPEELELQVETQKELIFRLKQKNFQGKSIHSFQKDYDIEKQKDQKSTDKNNGFDALMMILWIMVLPIAVWAITNILIGGFECTNGGGSSDFEFFLGSPDSAIEYCSDPTSNDVLAAEKYDSIMGDAILLCGLIAFIFYLWKWFIFNPKRKIRKAELPFNSNQIYSDYEKNKFSYEVENELLSDLKRRLRNSSEGLSKIKSMEDQIINDKELILVNINRIEVCEKEKLELWDKINHLIPYSEVLELS